MTAVNIVINGQQITTRAGQTILQAAREAGIEIPTLCDHPALKPIGACRVCLVEVSGQRTLQPACTYPVTDRMQVQTESPKVVKARKFVLELIFSERNHFCMYCAMSGNCELQDLGYRYGLDHWVYPTYTQRFPVDASPAHFLLDHNRCVLCRRCMRACSDLVANHTLDLRQRGAMAMLSADMGASLGESSCISCGNCLDVCPTGALIDKRSAFMTWGSSTEQIPSVCSQCSLGCGIELVARNGHLLRIQSRWDAPTNGGVLCRKGRFDALSDDRSRITSPMLRQNGRCIAADWEQALTTVARRLAAVDPRYLGVLTTTRATNEALTRLEQLFCGQLGTQQCGLFHPVTANLSSRASALLMDISGADCILVAGADPVQDHPVASFFIKRAVDAGSRLIVMHDRETALAAYADDQLPMAAADQAAAALQKARQPVVVYGSEVGTEAGRVLRQLGENVEWVPLHPGVNTHTALRLGLNRRVDPQGLQLAYILAGEEDRKFTDLVNQLGRDTLTVVQATYASALTERADVVLPMAAWMECSGTLTNTTGVTQAVNPARTPQGEAKQDWEILEQLTQKLNQTRSKSIQDSKSASARVY
jgi:NADH dehydrogenase/NADH:ubiquinone oxidoreductase subunit G